MVCGAILCASGWSHSEDLRPGSTQNFAAKVIAVLDGDTVLILRKGDGVTGQPPVSSLRARTNSLMKIRLAEIDAPEKAQAFGPASRNTLAEMVLRKQVWVNTLAVDKYGRDIAQLKVNGLSVNEEMVRRGMAWEYSHYHSDRRYIALQQEARQAGRGLWAQNDPMPPWQWRKQHAVETDASPVLSPRDYSCGTKHHCSQMRSCDEAYYYLTVCGVKDLNPGGDGVPCQKLCAGSGGR